MDTINKNATIQEVRWYNLKALRDQFGSNKLLADAANLDQGQVSHLLNKKEDGQTVRNIGSRLARKIEKNLNLSPGHLDTNRIPDSGEEFIPDKDQVRVFVDPYKLIFLKKLDQYPEDELNRLLMMMELDTQRFKTMEKLKDEE